MVRFLHRNRFAGDHRLIDGAASLDQHAIDGNFFSGTDPQAVARLYLIKRNVLFRAVCGDKARSSWTEIEQRSNGRTGAAAGAQFHDLPKQDQRGDGGSGFEVDVGISAHTAQ